MAAGWNSPWTVGGLIELPGRDPSAADDVPSLPNSQPTMWSRGRLSVGRRWVAGYPSTEPRRYRDVIPLVRQPRSHDRSQIS